MLEDILYVLGQLLLIGVYGVAVVVVFAVVIILILAIVKVILDTINGKGQ